MALRTLWKDEAIAYTVMHWDWTSLPVTVWKQMGMCLRYVSFKKLHWRPFGQQSKDTTPTVKFTKPLQNTKFNVLNWLLKTQSSVWLRIYGRRSRLRSMNKNHIIWMNWNNLPWKLGYDLLWTKLYEVAVTFLVCLSTKGKREKEWRKSKHLLDNSRSKSWGG